MIEFQSYPKIPRFEKYGYTVTEKIDGTNAAVIIDEDGNIGAQSRNRLLTLDDDNMGFAAWVEKNREELLTLGVGHHYGEWWGSGIQRRYFENDKNFSLFAWWLHDDEIPKCCRKVPVLGNDIEEATIRLKTEGSIASPGFLRPEGLVIYNNCYRGLIYKIIWDKGR